MSNLTDGQRRAFDAVKGGGNVFITGPGGVGKSYLLERIIEWAEEQRMRYVVCAPTGIAAVKVGGCTLHKAMGIAPQTPLEKWDNPELSYKSPINKCDLLVIDEISMCRIELFEYLAKCLVNMNGIRAVLHERPCQLVLLGDFYQLPPVMTPEDVPVLEALYGDELNDGYCIGSKAWDAMSLETVELTEVIRQSDSDFVDALNKCRHGDASGLDWIVEHASKVPLEGAIRLSGRNRDVDAENSLKLNMIDEPERVYKALIRGQVNVGMRLVPEEISLKVGARVMLVANQPDGVHVNGSMGYVADMSYDFVTVRFDDGSVMDIPPFTWKVNTPRVVGDRIVIEVTGEYTQMPLRLAWAITIHKSQGQTFDAVSLDPSCWENGQLYTALSRLSRVEGLYFTSPPDRSYLKAPSFEKQPAREVDASLVSFYYSMGHLALRGYELAQKGDPGADAVFGEMSALVDNMKYIYGIRGLDTID